MTQFFNVVRKEFGMSSRRVSVWIVFLILLVFYVGVDVAPLIKGEIDLIPVVQFWPAAALTIFKMNLFFPLVSGVLIADRLVRDHRVGVDELQYSAPISTTAYVLAKYIGVTASMLVPEFVTVICVALVPILAGLTSWAYLGVMLVCGVAISLPTMLFVAAFSLVCPMVMPVRVYQVLFVGYWFWGNFLSPEVFPTISGTLLNASGTFALQGFFGGTVGPGITYTAWQAVLNIAIILALAAAALTVGIRLVISRRGKK